MVAGIAPAGAAYALSAALSVAARTRPSLEPIYDQALLATLFLSLSVPLAFAYAVARHELFGVRLVIRMSIQYALARSALLWMLAIPVIGLVWTIWRQPDLDRARIAVRRHAACVPADRASRFRWHRENGCWRRSIGGSFATRGS